MAYNQWQANWLMSAWPSVESLCQRRNMYRQQPAADIAGRPGGYFSYGNGGIKCGGCGVAGESVISSMTNGWRCRNKYRHGVKIICEMKCRYFINERNAIRSGRSENQWRNTAKYLA
jgi:hypothetical protein